MIKDGPIEGQIPVEIEVTADKQGSEVNLDPLPEDPQLHQDLPAEVMTDA